jgi:LPXTG-site transpeptidase (sortase) family protein
MSISVFSGGNPGTVLAERSYAGAANDHTVLILDTSVSGGVNSTEALQAVALGYSVEMASAAQWAAKTQAEFATYRALILGDNRCSAINSIQAAISNRSTWSPVIRGNIMLIGGDPEFHAANSTQVGISAKTEIRQSIGFAAADAGKTGLYAAFGCAYASAPESGSVVDFLDQFGVFKIRGKSWDNVHKVADHVALDGLDDTTLSNWGQSTHAGFVQYPSSFVPVAIMKNLTGNGNVSFSDDTNGVPYMLGKGSDLVVIGAPAVSNFTITSGSSSGGTEVVITGKDFTGTTAITFGGTAASTFTVDSDTQITVTTPPHAAGVVDVGITNPAGTTTKGEAFTYIVGNSAPTNITVSNGTVEENESINTIVGVFTTTDVDSGDSFNYTLVSGIGSDDNALFNITGASLQTNAIFDYETKQSYSIRVRSTDPGNLYVEKEFTISVTNVNEAPTNIGLDSLSVNEEQPAGIVVGILITIDGDAGQTFTYTFDNEAGVCDGVNNTTFTIDENKLKTAKLLEYEHSSAHSFSICVLSTDNGSPALSTKKQFTINLVDVNDFPVLKSPILDQYLFAGDPFSMDFPGNSFIDEDDDTLTYSATLQDGSPLPSWLLFTADMRLFSGTPAASDAGTYQIMVTASDGKGGTATNTFYLSVDVEGNQPPKLLFPISDITVYTGSAFTYMIAENTFADPDSSTALTYTTRMENGANLPAWLTFNPATLTFSGTPPVGSVDPLDVMVSAFDAQGGNIYDIFRISVNINESTNEPPVVQISLPDKNAVQGTAFSYTVSASTFFDPDGDQIIYSASLADGNPLPDWLTFDTITRTFSGIPGASDVGALLVRVRGMDSAENFASDIFRLAVSAADSTENNRVLSPAGNTELGESSFVTVSAGIVMPDSHTYIQLITSEETSGTPNGFTPLNKVIDVRIYGGNNELFTNFEGELTICFRLTETEMNEWDISKLLIGTSSGDETSFTLLPTTFNRATRTVCATTNHLSLYELFTPIESAEMPESGFAPGVITIRPEPAENAKFEALDGLKLEIPRLNVSESIVGVYPSETGWDISWLGDQIGWLNSTAFPTWNGNSVLTGHVADADGQPSVFARLGELKYGDQIIVYLNGQKYTFEVRKVNTLVDPHSKAAFAHEDQPWLTLITCQGYNEKTGEYDWRIVVKALLVSVR